MEDNKFTEFIKKHRGEVEKIKASNTAISDEEMAKVTGGVGGANEATCPECGTPMNVINANGEYGDRSWVCPKCKRPLTCFRSYTILSQNDACPFCKTKFKK